MCILLKLDYVKFGVSNLFFFQKLSKKNLSGGRLDPPLLVKEGLKESSIIVMLIPGGRGNIDIKMMGTCLSTDQNEKLNQ